MANYTKKEIRFLSNWEKTRLNKKRFVVLFGGVVFGFIAGLISYFLNILLKVELFNIKHLGIRLVIFFLLGMLYGMFMFRINENKYAFLKKREQ